MLVISSREFQSNQKKYFDLIDKKDEKIIIKRGRTKSYRLEPAGDNEDLMSNPAFLRELLKSMAEVRSGDTIRVAPEDLKKFLGLE